MTTQPLRRPAIDALRGVAMVWMTAYHFCYDLNWFGLWRQNFTGDAFWWLQRSAIVALFMFCAGYGQALAIQAGQDWPRFARRWMQIAAAAAVVSVASWVAFPRSWIYFGVLHAFVLMLPILRWAGPALLRVPYVLWAVIIAALVATWLAPRWPGTGPWADMLNGPPANVLGWVSRKPVTEDYVPVLPWLAPLLLGFWAGGRGLMSGAGAPIRPSGPVGRSRALSRLALLGRFSLSYYLLHQPVLIGLLWLGLAVLR